MDRAEGILKSLWNTRTNQETNRKRGSVTPVEKATAWLSSWVMSLTNAHTFTNAPTWLLGRRYQYLAEVHTDGSWRMEAFKIDLLSRIWVTYRKGFPAITAPLRSYSGDVGWGCMLRSGQMIFAQGLLCNFLGRDWSLGTSGSPVLYHQILSMFLDYPVPQCPYSLHNMLTAGQCFGKHAGEWHGPNATCVMLQKCLERDPFLSDDLAIIVAQDSTIYLDELTQACTRSASSNTTAHISTSTSSSSISSTSSSSSSSTPSTASYSSSQPASFARSSSSVCPPKPPTPPQGSSLGGTDTAAKGDCDEAKINERLGTGPAAETAGWKSVIIFIPIRLGVENINPKYIEALLRCFQFSQSIGIIGGKPQKSLYFVGVQERRVFYLDPHTVQGTLPLGEGLAEQTSSYHCASTLSVDVAALDPSLAIGFYCKDREDVMAFWDQARMVSALKHPVFHVANEAPDYAAMAEAAEDDWGGSGDEGGGTPEGGGESITHKRHTSKAELDSDDEFVLL